MKELAEPAAIVAKAEIQIGAIEELARKIKSNYSEAVKLRNKLNAVGLDIGREIIDACRHPEIATRLQVLNAKESKPLGGTDTKAHSWVAEQLAKATGYNADYLKHCARQYLLGLNAHLEQTRQKPAQYVKGGVLKLDVKELPVIEAKPPATKPQEHPRMDEVFEEPKTETKAAPELPPEEIGLKLAEEVARKAGLDGDAVNPRVVKGLVKGLAPILEQNGFAILPQKKGGQFK